MHRNQREGDEGGGHPDEPIGLERGERLALVLSPHVLDAVPAHPGVDLVRARARARARARVS